MDLLEEFSVQPVHEIVDEGFVVCDFAFTDENVEVGNVIIHGFLSLFRIFEIEAHSTLRIDGRECLLNFFLKTIPCSKVG